MSNSYKIYYFKRNQKSGKEWFILSENCETWDVS